MNNPPIVFISYSQDSAEHKGWVLRFTTTLSDRGIDAVLDDIKQAFFSSALVNLKKSNGRKKSNNNDLKKYVNADWDFIYSQIKAIQPKIVICGRTWNLISDKLPDKTRISDRVYLAENIIYIDFWHPANRASKSMSYYAIISLFKIALNNKILKKAIK